MANPAHADDKCLSDRCLAGEPAAWEAFVERFQPFLADAIRRTLRKYRAAEDPVLIQELLQESWVTLLNDRSAVLRRFDWRLPLRSILGAVAISRTVDRLRQQRGMLSLDSGGEEALGRELLSPSPEAESNALDAGERRERIARALTRLAPQEQAALRLFYWEALPAEGIARILQLKPGSVRSLLARCREKLRIVASRSLLLLL